MTIYDTISIYVLDFFIIELLVLWPKPACKAIPHKGTVGSECNLPAAPDGCLMVNTSYILLQYQS